jgi:low affinity Fe/Cu permease
MSEYTVKIILLIFGFIAAVIAIFGDTWNKEKKRLTKLGVALLISIFCSLMFGVWQEYQTKVKEEKLKAEATNILLRELAPVQAYLDSMIRKPRQKTKELLSTVDTSVDEVEAKFNRYQHLLEPDAIKKGEELLVSLKCLVLEVEKFNGSTSQIAVLIEQAYLADISFTDALFNEVTDNNIKESYNKKLGELCLAISGQPPLSKTKLAPISGIEILIINHTLKELQLEQKGAFIIFDPSIKDQNEILLSGDVVFRKKGVNEDIKLIPIKSENIALTASIHNSYLLNSYLDENNLDLQICFKFGGHILAKKVKFIRSELQNPIFLRLTRLDMP